MVEADVLVLGGGLAGLSAALELQRQGRQVLVLERAARLGGKAGSTVTSAGVFPDGPTSFNGRAEVFWRFLSLLGLEDEVARVHGTSASRYLVRDGKLRGLRSSPLSLLTTRALSLNDKFAMAKEFFTRSSNIASEDESLRSLLERRFGRACVEHVFEAVLTGVFAGDLGELSVRSCFPALVDAEAKHGGVIRAMLAAPKAGRAGIYTFTRGFSVIGERAAARVPNVCGVSAERIDVDARGVLVRCEDGREFRGRSLVLAVEADIAARLLEPVAPSELSTFDAAPLALVQWSERSPGDSRMPRGFGYLAAPVEKTFALGTLFVGDLLDESPRRFSTFIGGALQRARAAAPDDELLEGTRADVKRLTGGVVGDVHRVVRWPRAVFQPRVGHFAAMQRVRARLASTPIVLAGSYCGGAAMKDALASGFAAAKALEVAS